MFITTANRIDTIPPALEDRMEVISLPGYTEQEKLIIAKRYLIPKQMKENGLKRSLLRFGDKAVEKLIRDYTREAGVRNLEREIAAVSRKVAKRLAEGKKNKVMITPQNLHSFLGPLKFMPETAIATDIPGVACGLAWTETGGELLFVEASCRKGRRELTLTGSMGDVMKESAQAALTYIKAKAKQLGIPQESFDELEMHIHVPQGAIPKDGPSAGVTMAVAMISALTQRVVASKIAMTGEITLTGRVLPIGGLKEKTLAALRARLKKVIIPEENLKDLEDIPDYVKKKVTFLPVKDMDDVVKLLFSAPPTKRRPLPGKRVHRERSLLLQQR
jgi:ATP-dependent Lon protease